MSPRIPNGFQIFIGVSVALSFLTAPVAARPPGDRLPGRANELLVPDLKVERYTLPNGLTVILHEDHKTPLVAVNVLYKVGSKDDEPGRSGLAHLFEHMMFQGSKPNARYDQAFEGLGSSRNAHTNKDWTEYYETVPSNGLERVLWAEADRMGFLLTDLTDEKLENVREVIKNERRETVDNIPYGLASEVLKEAIYPPGHPYRHSTIGSMAELSAARMADVRAFYQRHYTPNHAFLCVAGDVQPDQTRRWIARYFGPLHRGVERTPLTVSVPSFQEARKITLADRVSRPRVDLVWTTVPVDHPDEPALDVLAAILGGLAKESRLSRALMYDRPLATGVDAWHPTALMAGTFEIQLYAPPKQRLDELVGIIDVEIERLKRDGPTVEEVRKAQDDRERSLVMSLESVSGKAAILNEYAARLGDPLAYRNPLAKVFAVTPEDVKRVARAYLGTRRIELDVVPGEPAARPPEVADDRKRSVPQGLVPAQPIADGFDRAVMPGLGPKPRFVPPRVERRRLANGLELLIVERHGLPLVHFRLAVKAGETLTPKGKEGLGSITASLLDEGTRSRSALQLAGELSDIGASLGTYGALEYTTVDLSMLARHLERGLDLYADVILNPAFDATELGLLKTERLVNLIARGDDAQRLARDVCPRLIYGPDHPYGRPEWGTPGSIQSITRDDVVAFYRKIFVPGNAVLVVVGDVRNDAITAALEARFGTWTPGPIPRQPPLPPTPEPAGYESIYLIDKPRAVQSILTLCKVGMARGSPDYYALTVMNMILEGRINENLREGRGFTYGVTSTFHERRGPGPFELGGPVQTGSTAKALDELIQELTNLADPESDTASELVAVKEQLVFNDYSELETTVGTAGQVASQVISELPIGDFTTYPARIEAVTKAEVSDVASRYVAPERMTVLVVGDKVPIEHSLRSLLYVKQIRRLDSSGNPIPSAPVVLPSVPEPVDPFAVDPPAPAAKRPNPNSPRASEKKEPSSAARPK
ncbi:MAG: M16 family metallopeptidase [Isosphaeraceae bacterium]